eukprot:CAMPEP_0204839206 /NCGR_PEP_ID=MMETSP1346-20131115/33471_1 /ASSEMBLY_ACC=CAM_ASM_000771 /TAXON_ID=215587 /ORGANISM="Aplanochytrium stocchinoi, Strain GSBS06" /LENGTH=235 /DNA_ID=CAMNT_0051975777 /DNA_START=260 /DNA_END=967 /DNA_ORIENTATION=-
MFRERVKTGGRSALLLGSTGATGKYVLKELLERDEWTRIVLVGRRAPTDLKVDDAGKQVDVIIADLVKPLVELTSDDLAKLQGVDHVFNCIGTTRAKAGGADGFEAIEVGISTKVFKAAASAGIKSASLISAQSAHNGPGPRFFHPLFYGKTMYRKEQSMINQGFTKTTVFRPGMLERLADGKPSGNVLKKMLNPLHVDILAKAMVNDAESKTAKDEEKTLFISGNPTITAYANL